MKCPHCRSDRLRRSRQRSGDGLWRRLVLTPYRCLTCGKRTHHLTPAPVLLAMGVAVLATGLGIASFVNALGSSERRPAALASSSAGMSEAYAQSPGGEGGDTAAAEEGDAQAQLRLGLALLDGQARTRDPAAGVRWIEAAAEQGLAEAQYALGMVYLSGRDALQSFPLALQWFERAARQNHAEAQYSLGTMFRNGQGVPVNRSQAYVWFNLAAAQGHARAANSRDGMISSLTPEQVVAAQRTAQEWRAAAVRTQ